MSKEDRVFAATGKVLNIHTDLSLIVPFFVIFYPGGPGNTMQYQDISTGDPLLRAFSKGKNASIAMYHTSFLFGKYQSRIPNKSPPVIPITISIGPRNMLKIKLPK